MECSPPSERDEVRLLSLLTIMFIVAVATCQGAVTMYFTRGGEGLGSRSSGAAGLTPFEPFVGFLTILFIPFGTAMMLCYGLAGVVGLALFYHSNGTSNSVLEGARFAFPVGVAFLLTITLVSKLLCPQNLVAARRARNKAARAQQALSGMVDSDGPSLTRVSLASSLKLLTL